VIAKRLLFIPVVLSLAAVGGCTVDKQNAPDLTGPSAMGLAFEITASPDVLFRDGSSQSTIEVTVRDSNGNLVANQSMFIAGQLNLGTLSAATGKTNSSGKVAFLYTSPAPGADTTTTLTVTPVGTNTQNTVGRTVAIRLVRPPA